MAASGKGSPAGAGVKRVKLYDVGMKYWGKYREQMLYLFFGGVTTLVNIAAYALLARAGMSTGAANAVAWVLAVLVAYATNRVWVFRSGSRGAAAVKEFLSFIACRVGTGVMDEVIMIVGVDRLHLWGLGVKVFSNVLVIVMNYVFSKLFIFRKK